MKDDFTTNSHYLIYTFLFRKVGRMYFLNLGVKGLNVRVKGLSFTLSKEREIDPNVKKFEKVTAKDEAFRPISFQSPQDFPEPQFGTFKYNYLHLKTKKD